MYYESYIDSFCTLFRCEYRYPLHNTQQTYIIHICLSALKVNVCVLMFVCPSLSWLWLEECNLCLCYQLDDINNHTSNYFISKCLSFVTQISLALKSLKRWHKVQLRVLNLSIEKSKSDKVGQKNQHIQSNIWCWMKTVVDGIVEPAKVGPIRLSAVHNVQLEICKVV